MRPLTIAIVGMWITLNAGCKKDVVWQEHGTGGGYTFEMPGIAEAKVDTTPSGVVFHTLIVSSKGREYVVSVYSINTHLTFDYAKGLNAAAMHYKGSVTSLTDFNFDDNILGKAFVIDATDNSTRAVGRAVRTGSHYLFIFAVSGPNVQESDADVQRFLGSMKKIAAVPGPSPKIPPSPPAKTPDTPSEAKALTRLEQVEKDLGEFATKFFTEIGRGRFSNAYAMLSADMKGKETKEAFIARIKSCDALNNFERSTQTYSNLILTDDRGGTVTANCEGKQKTSATVILKLLSIRSQRMSVIAMEIKDSRAP